jgi:integrase
MNLIKTELIFDTLLDTHKNYVSKMNTSFKLRKDLNKDGMHPIYIHITGNGTREFINTGIHVHPKNWLTDKQRIKPITKELSDQNLVLDKIESKLHDIKIAFRLTDIYATPELIKKEFLNNLSRINFISFYEESLKLESSLGAGRVRILKSILNKIREYKDYIPFHEMDLTWFKNYRLWLKNVKKNNEVTISTNLRAIKKFLRIAQKSGIRLRFDLDELKPGKTTGNREYLNEAELKKAMKFYFSDFINETNKIVLGYFLFGCMTGLRISNIQRLKRKDFQNNEFSLIMVKGNKDKILSLNETAKRILEHCPELFEKKYTNEELNRQIKRIMLTLGIPKRISFHCARHTFATMMLRSGSKLELLQQLLGHTNVKHTMIYTHIIQEDANKELFLLDNMFKA